MSFDWAEYLNLADALYRQRDTFANREACMRAAVSRGYYAAFCAARNRARDKDGLALSSDATDHRMVKDHYAGSSDRTRQKIGTLLTRLRNNRNQVDYQDTISALEPLSIASLKLAHDLFNFLQHL